MLIISRKEYIEYDLYEFNSKLNRKNRKFEKVINSFSIQEVQMIMYRQDDYKE